MPAVLFDFSNASAVPAWRAIDDRVMGGVSQSRLRHDAAGHAVFEGVVSLARNGGFASVRSEPGALGLPGATTCLIDVCGDGKTYKLSLLSDNGFDSVSHQFSFTPGRDGWQTLSLPLARFSPSFRGREVPDAPPLDPARIRQVGLLVAQRQEGAFALQIRRISLATRTLPTRPAQPEGQTWRGTMPGMRLATWNVNSLSVRLPQVLDWLAREPVDLLALQELKLTDDRFPHAELAAAGYQAVAFGQKTYNGVALLSRAPVADVQRNLPGLADEQARVLTATLGEGEARIRVIGAYFPNGQAPGSDKFEYKMGWLRAMREHVRAELEVHPRLVLMGDYNITADDRDTWDPVGLAGTIHHTEEERHHFRALLDLGLVDAFRLFEQPERSFSWWDYREFAFRRNRGLRIDHILVSQALQPAVRGCSVDRTPRKNERPSDHTPVVVELG